MARPLGPWGRTQGSGGCSVLRGSRPAFRKGRIRVIDTAHDRLAVSDETGQGLTEYALILVLVVILAIIAPAFLGGAVSEVLSNVGNSA